MKTLIGFLMFVALFLFVASGNAQPIYQGAKSQVVWARGLSARLHPPAKLHLGHLYAVRCIAPASAKTLHSCGIEYANGTKTHCFYAVYNPNYSVNPLYFYGPGGCTGAPKPPSIGAA